MGMTLRNRRVLRDMRRINAGRRGLTEVVEVKLMQRGQQDTGSRIQRRSRSSWGSETTKEQSRCENWARRERIRPGVNV